MASEQKIRSTRPKNPLKFPIKAERHTPVYTIHKFWARRPWNLFSALLNQYTRPGDIVLDPFCGGGVTVVEAMALHRRVVGVDVNPLAAYITKMEVSPFDSSLFHDSFERVKNRTEELEQLYRTKCPKCGEDSVFDWMEWDESKKVPLRLKVVCKCGSHEKSPDAEDVKLANKNWKADLENLWYPKASIPSGDKTDVLRKKGITHFEQLFTRRNLFALATILEEIKHLPPERQEFMSFAFSSSLKWASRMCHLRHTVVEGWALHAYWIYPKSLELNIWRVFERRARALTRGKDFSNKTIGSYYRLGKEFGDFASGATCLVINRSSQKLPIPSNSIDAVITDPPYGGNVNYGELADYWLVWIDRDRLMDKTDEAIINKPQKKVLLDYENHLSGIFSECARVLKINTRMVMTFNSNDPRVVASCIKAAARSGFTLDSDGVVYQPPITAYSTTSHGIFVGSFLGDFILSFQKSKFNPTSNKIALVKFKSIMENIVQEYDQGQGSGEEAVKRQIYCEFLPFLARNVMVNPISCDEALSCVRTSLRILEKSFNIDRQKIIEERRATFLRSSSSSLQQPTNGARN